MIQSITNNILLDLREIKGLDSKAILREIPQTNPNFPCIVVEEGNLSVSSESRDSAGFHHTNYELNIEIFTRGSGKINEMARLREDIDNIISGNYGLERVFSKRIPNMGDVSIYRYRLTYICKLDNNKIIYRR